MRWFLISTLKLYFSTIPPPNATKNDMDCENAQTAVVNMHHFKIGRSGWNTEAALLRRFWFYQRTWVAWMIFNDDVTGFGQVDCLYRLSLMSTTAHAVVETLRLV